VVGQCDLFDLGCAEFGAPVVWKMSDKLTKICDWSLVLMVHTCDPSYPGGTDQEDHSSKPAQGK
jgi:hypothetical protein